MRTRSVSVVTLVVLTLLWLSLIGGQAILSPPAGMAQAGIYYVDQSHPLADDDNAGTEAEPWLTIQHAADVAVAGDTIIVKAGTYNERVVPQNSGTAEAKITFRAEPRRSVAMWGFYTVNSDYLRIEGFDITTDASLTGWTESRGVFIHSDYVEVVDNYFHDINANAIAGYWHEPYPQSAYIADNRVYHCQAGIVVQGDRWIVERNEVERLYQYGAGDCDYSRFFGTNHIIRDNYFHGTDFDEIGEAHVDCFQTFTNNGEVTHDILFEGNLCYDFHQALMASNVENTATSHFTFRNNVFARGHAWGLCVHNVSYITAENNTFADIAYHGAGFRDNSIGNVMRNNIFYNIGSSYWASDGGEVTGDYNLIFEANDPGTPGSHDMLGVDPLFVDAANYDYRLLAGSPAIDAGESLPQVTRDFDGNARPHGAGWDIGAHEFLPDLILGGRPADRAIHLSWAVNITMPATATWQIRYEQEGGTLLPPPVDIPTATVRAHTLSGLTNYAWYSVTLNAMLDATPILTDSVRLMPTGIAVYLPLVMKNQ